MINRQLDRIRRRIDKKEARLDDEMRQSALQRQCNERSAVNKGPWGEFWKILWA